jgi:hypothetical protein
MVKKLYWGSGEKIILVFILVVILIFAGGSTVHLLVLVGPVQGHPFSIQALSSFRRLHSNFQRFASLTVTS